MSLAHLILTSDSSNTGFSRARPVHCLSLSWGSFFGRSWNHSLNFFSFPNTVVPSWGPGAFWVTSAWIPNSRVCPCWSLTLIIGFWGEKFCERCFLFSCPKKAELVLSMRTWSSEPGRLEDLAENLWPLEPSAAPSPQYLVSTNRPQKGPGKPPLAVGSGLKSVVASLSYLYYQAY